VEEGGEVLVRGQYPVVWERTDDVVRQLSGELVFLVTTVLPGEDREAVLGLVRGGSRSTQQPVHLLTALRILVCEVQARECRAVLTAGARGAHRIVDRRLCGERQDTDPVVSQTFAIGRDQSAVTGEDVVTEGGDFEEVLEVRG